MAGNLIAPVEDGKIVETASQSSLAKKTGSDSMYSKETFLQLLVAEVQNQDPLEPTSNTEWISQYATFSELEAMQNMGASFELSRASSLVGQTVVIETTNSSGVSSTIQGKVDYVTYEAGKAYVSVNGSMYSLEDVTNIIDTSYLNAFDKVYEWSVELNKLPSLANVSWEDVENIESLYKQYTDMSDYEKSFVATENSDKIQEYYDKAQDVRAIHQAAVDALESLGAASEATDEETDSAEETDEVEETENTGSPAAEAGIIEVTDEQIDSITEEADKEDETGE